VEFLSNPIFQFIVSLVIGIIAIIIPSVVFLIRQVRRRIAYEVIANIPLTSIRDEAKGLVEILFNHRSINDAYLIILRIWNSGNIPIRPYDYLGPIKFDFGEEAEVLGFKVLETVPSTLKTITRLQFDNNQVALEPLLLNPSDSIKIQVLTTRFAGKISIIGRIIELNEIELETDVVGRVMVRRELILGGLHRVRGFCTGVLGLILGAWLTTVFLQKQVVDYQFLYLSTIVLGVLIGITWLLEKTLSRKDK
jgi:hypothetical protein